MIEFSRQSKNKMTLAGARAALTSTKVCAIIELLLHPLTKPGSKANTIFSFIGGCNNKASKRSS